MAIILYSVWAAINSEGYHIPFLGFLALMAYVLICAALVSVLSRAGVPTAVIRILVFIAICIFVAIALSSGLLP